jgi:hypothetical protein
MAHCSYLGVAPFLFHYESSQEDPAGVSRKGQPDFRLKQVSIVPKDDYLGIARSVLGLSLAELEHESLDSKMVARWHDRVICLFAGGEAERLLVPTRLSPGSLRGDLKGVQEIVWRLHPLNEQAVVFRYLRIRAQNLVSQPINRRMIRDLADVLVERRSLDGPEVLSIFRGLPSGFNKWAVSAVSFVLMAQMCKSCTAITPGSLARYPRTAFASIPAGTAWSARFIESLSNPQVP